MVSLLLAQCMQAADKRLKQPAEALVAVQGEPEATDGLQRDKM